MTKNETPFTATGSAFWTWANKTLDAWIAEHEGHGKTYHANCRSCLVRAVTHHKTSEKAKALYESTLANKGVYFINSVIQEYNLAENGVDFVDRLT
jgi:hypothetical protein